MYKVGRSYRISVCETFHNLSSLELHELLLEKMTGNVEGRNPLAAGKHCTELAEAVSASPHIRPNNNAASFRSQPSASSATTLEQEREIGRHGKVGMSSGTTKGFSSLRS